MKYLYKKADGFVFQTEDAAKYFEGIIKCDSKIIPNPINPKFIKEPYKGEREKNIVTVGRLESQKNQKMLIEAFGKIESKYPEYSLLIYGDGSKKEELQDLIKEKGLENKVILKGKIDDVENVIDKAKMFVLSSDYEGMPNALMEAMALGLPCISTDCPCGGPRYLMENGKSGLLVPVGNSDAMA
jgi:glycosyltransferase involved in cell wall biosynthesis